MNTEETILARMTQAETALAEAPAWVMWMPAGEHTVHATRSGRPVEVTVRVDRETAAVLQRALGEHLAAGAQRPYFDFDHDNKAASAWPKRFVWEPGSAGKPAGVYALVEWSEPGRAAVAGRSYRSFSPAFFIDAQGRVTGAPLNMGGLVNDPAFRQIAPLWCKDGSTAGELPDNPHTMENDMTGAGAAKAPTHEEALAAKEAQVVSLRNENEALKAREAQARKTEAAAAVQAAIARGALPPKDAALHARWTALLEADPAHAQLLAALPGHPALRPATQPEGARIEARDGLVETLRAYAARSSTEREVIYARDIAAEIAKGARLGPILAANSLGTLAGDLVVRRALALLKQSFPILSRISSDFSAEAAAYGQGIKTRLRTVPAVTDYSTSTGYATSDATTTDVTCTLNAHKAVQIGFNANELGATDRDLFGEQAEAAHYALGKVIVDALYALITAGNYANATVKATASITRADVTAMAKALYARGVQPMGRSLIVNPDVYERLMSDSTVVNLAAYQRPEVITDYVLPPIAGFEVIQAVNLPSAGNLTGFGCAPDAWAIATRVPNDYSTVLPGANYGSISVVRNPDTGIAVQLCQYINHQMGSAYWRAAVMYGVAVGQAASGQRLTSA